MNVKDRMAASILAQKERPLGVVEVIQGDARMIPMADESVNLVVTSPPYFNLKKYEGESAEQLGDIGDFDLFVGEMRKVIVECFRVLKPGGRLCINTGDVCLSRKTHGRHSVLPLHAHYQVEMGRVGFDMLSSIIWEKISKAGREVDKAGGCLGKPYEPNAVIKNDIEYILVGKKPGPYRKVSDQIRMMSMINKEDFSKWMTQIWRMPGASTKKGHPAPFPLEVPHRLISLYSFVGDVVLDPFAGSGTTGVAAKGLGRNAVLVECSPRYVELIRDKIK
jgi:DNA modification methylase